MKIYKLKLRRDYTDAHEEKEPNLDYERNWGFELEETRPEGRKIFSKTTLHTSFEDAKQAYQQYVWDFLFCNVADPLCFSYLSSKENIEVEATISEYEFGLDPTEKNIPTLESREETVFRLKCPLDLRKKLVISKEFKIQIDLSKHK